MKTPWLLLLAVGPILACHSNEAIAPGGPTNDKTEPDAGTHADASAPATGLWLQTDGTRLKARWFEGPDHQRSFAGWYDSQLKVDCSVLRTVDGEYRCIPADLSVGTDFADAACATPVVVNNRESCTTYQFAVRLDNTNSCQTRYRVYKLGAKLTATETIYWKPAATCEAGGILEGAAAYHLGDELPVSMFVRFQAKPEASKGASDTVQFVVLEGDDGSKSDGGWRLAGATDACLITTMGDGKNHCVPGSGVVSGATFSDANCSMGLVATQPACGLPEVVRQTRAGSCPATNQLFELGPKVESVFRVRPTDNMCAASVIAVGAEYHQVGAAIADDRYPIIDQVVDNSAQRIRRRKNASPGGRQVGSNWFDSARNEPCTPYIFGDVRRCAPFANFAGYVFSDDKCTQPIWQGSKNTCPPTYVYGVVDKACPTHDQFYKIGADYTGPAFQLRTIRYDTYAQEECEALTPTADAIFKSLVPIDDSQFVEMKLVEPTP